MRTNSTISGSAIAGAGQHEHESAAHQEPGLGDAQFGAVEASGQLHVQHWLQPPHLRQRRGFGGRGHTRGDGEKVNYSLKGPHSGFSGHNSYRYMSTIDSSNGYIFNPGLK